MSKSWSNWKHNYGSIYISGLHKALIHIKILTLHGTWQRVPLIFPMKIIYCYEMVFLMIFTMYLERKKDTTDWFHFGVQRVKRNIIHFFFNLNIWLIFIMLTNIAAIENCVLNLLDKQRKQLCHCFPLNPSYNLCSSTYWKADVSYTCI